MNIDIIELAALLGQVGPDNARRYARTFVEMLQSEITGFEVRSEDAGKPRRIYVASSWRNAFQQPTVQLLEGAGHQVYDFRNPPKSDGFSWAEVDENWQSWSFRDWVKAFEHPRAVEGYNNDMNAMKWANTCVLVLPCGASAHFEAGWFSGSGRDLYVYQPPGSEFREAELMLSEAHGFADTPDGLLELLKGQP